MSSVRLIQERYEDLVFEVFDSEKNETCTVVQRLRSPEKIVREIRKRSLTVKATYTLTAMADGTQVTFAMSASLKGYRRLLSPFMKGQLSKSLVTHFLEPIKRVAEAHGQRANLDEDETATFVPLNGQS